MHLPAQINGTTISVPFRPPKEHLWGDDFDGRFNFRFAQFDYHDVSAPNDLNALAAFQQALLKYGAAVVKNIPSDLETYETFLLSFGRIRSTNWGKWFEVVAKPATMAADASNVSMRDAAYSHLGIPLHTDGPYNPFALQYQVLLCLKQSKVGGESSLSDGHAAAMLLRQEDPGAFELLTRIPVRFRFATARHATINPLEIAALIITLHSQF